MNMTNKEKFEEFVKSVGNYEIVSEYINANTLIDLLHEKCGKIYKVRPGKFKYGDRCSNCRGRNKTTKDFKKEVFDLEGDFYTVLGKYENCNKKVKVRHNICGTEYEVRRNKFLLGNRCPECSNNRNSKLSRELERVLKGWDINFKKEYTFKDCKNIVSLPFDFSIIINNEVVSLIECDGEQHFKPVKIFGGEEYYKKVIKNDNIKNKYCLDNNIPLLRLKYDEIELVKEKVKIFLNIDNNNFKLVSLQYNKYCTSIENIIKIRKEYKGIRGDITKLAKKYKISRQSIRRIINKEIAPNV